MRPGFPELVERFHPLIVSSGLHELIKPVLEREGVEVELLANRRCRARTAGEIVWRDEVDCPVCGEPCKRTTLPLGDGAIVFVGDG